MELNRTFEEIVNHILYLKNFGQEIPKELTLEFLNRYNKELPTIIKEDTKKEAIIYYERNKTIL